MKNIIDKLLLLSFVILIAGVLYCDIPYFMDSAIKSKWFVFECFSIFIGLAFLVSAIRQHTINIPKSTLVYPLVLLFVWVLLKNTNSFAHFINTFSGILFYIILLVFFLKIVKQNILTQCLYALSVLVVFNAIIAIFQWFGVIQGTADFKVVGFYDNPAGFAASMCVALPIVILSLKQLRYKCVGYIAVLLILISIILSESRSGIIASCTIISIAILKNNVNWQKYKWGKLFGLLIVVSSIISCLYFYKKDSADGRLLIWQASFEMIKEKPLLGWNKGGFGAHYMEYQANHLETIKEVDTKYLADEINHPFNEYILFFIEYGFIGFFLLGLCLFLVLKNLFYNKNEKVYYSTLSILALCLFAITSYPFRYPFMFVMPIFSLAIIIKDSKTYSITNKVKNVLLIILFPVFLYLSFYTLRTTYGEYKWFFISEESLKGNTTSMIPEYEKIYPYMMSDPLFLYNYGAELNEISKYDEAIEILNQCKESLNGYDLQMLFGMCYFNNLQDEDAIQHFKKAYRMAPKYFMPLYQLFLVYERAERKAECIAVANEILEKKPKIQTANVSYIKNYVENRIKGL